MRSMERPSSRWRKKITPGSTSPDRVPIIRPSSGVRPILVSMDFPPSSAAMLTPLPRWHMIILTLFRGFPSKPAALWLTYRYDIP